MPDQDQPLPHSLVSVHRLEWPSHDLTMPIPGMDFHLRLTNRPNGDAGIAPLAAPNERELGRFVAAYCRAVFPVGDDGKPLPPTQAGPLREVCIGGGEVVLTDRRVGIVLIKASGALGNVDDERGSVIVIDVPYRAVGSVAVVREKALFRGIKARQVRCYTNRPTAAIDIEPIARFSHGEDKPTRIELGEFFESFVQAACDDLLNVTLMEAEERERLRGVRNGARVIEDLDIVAELVK